MSFSLPTSVDTATGAIPIIPKTASLGKMPGVPMHFGSLAMLNAAITASSSLWDVGQTFTVSGEPWQVVRKWNGTDALTIFVAGITAFRLGNSSNTVGLTTGAPSGSTGNAHDYLLDTAAGVIYEKINSGTWGAAQFAYAASAASSSSGTPVPTLTTLPVISGTAQVGQTLTTTSGAWTNSPTGFLYQWARDGIANISGATSSTYVPTSADVGHTINVGVTAVNAGGASTQAVSAQTSAVTAASASSPVVTQIRFAGLTNGPVTEVGSAAPYTYNGADAGRDTNYATNAQVNIPANKDFRLQAKVRQPDQGNDAGFFLTAALGASQPSALFSVDGNHGVRLNGGTPTGTVLSDNIATDRISIKRTNSTSSTNVTYTVEVSHDDGVTWVDPNSLTGQTSAPALFIGAAFNGTAGLSDPVLTVFP